MQPELVLDELVGPPLPTMAVRAWQVFGELSGTRSAGMHGVGAITYTEMAAYQGLTGTRLTPLDVALIREADAVFLAQALRTLTDRPNPADDDSQDYEHEE